jgi:phospholipid N-methyltransferase
MKAEFGKETWPRLFDDPLPPDSVSGRIGLSKTLAIYWRFLLAGLLHRTQTGSVVPSQRFLIGQMLAPVPPSYSGQIIELGAGTGAVTRRLAARCPHASIIACEINPGLARDLEYNLAASALSGRVEVVCDSAEHLLARRRREGSAPPDFIFSGIPLGNLPRELVLALISAIKRALAPGGMYIQFQYSLMDRKKIKSNFSKLRTVPAFLNFPPAFVYYAQK